MPDTNPTRARRAERQLPDRRLFDAVQDAYLQLLDLPPIAAMVLDHDQPRPGILAGTAIDFKIDIEKATEVACQKLDEQAAWFALLRGEPVECELQARVVQQCSLLYRARSLHPRLYFRRDRHAAARRSRL